MDVGMAVPKPQKLDKVVAVSKQDRVYKDYTSNPIPTSFLASNWSYSQQPNGMHSPQKSYQEKRCIGMGLLV